MISCLTNWKECICRLKIWKLISLKLSVLIYHFESLPDPPPQLLISQFVDCYYKDIL